MMVRSNGFLHGFSVFACSLLLRGLLSDRIMEKMKIHHSKTFLKRKQKEMDAKIKEYKKNKNKEEEFDADFENLIQKLKERADRCRIRVRKANQKIRKKETK